MRRLPLLLVVLAWPLVAAASAATTHPVTIGDDFYRPESITVTGGDTVQWRNEGLKQHTVTFTGQDGAEPLLPTETTTETFNTAGTYRYFCEIHPSMRGSVVVRRSTTSTTARPTTTTTEGPDGSSRTGTPETSTTTTSSTTTTAMPGESTTTTSVADGSAAGGGRSPGDDGDTNVDAPAALAAVLLLGAGGAAFHVTRTSLA